MKYKKLCKCCGKEFETNSPQKLYCDREHWLPCPVCGRPVLKKDKDFTRPPRACSSKCAFELKVMKMEKRKCSICGEEFSPRSGCNTICPKEHHINCVICGKDMILHRPEEMKVCSDDCRKEFLRRRNRERYGVDHPMQNPEIRQHFKDAMLAKYGVEAALQIPGAIQRQQESAMKTNLERNGVPYACLLPQCIEAQGKIVSNINHKFSEILKNKGIEYSMEKKLGGFSYDFFIEQQKTFVEIDPTYTHSSIPNHWGTSRDSNYHLDKTKLAEENGYRCIHVFDWDDWNKIVDIISPKKKLGARKCTIYRLWPKYSEPFLRENHIQGSCRGQLLHFGLVFDDEIYQVMTFGKSRYDKSHSVELLRLCTKRGYQVVGGASRLFKYATENFGINDIISYCDRAKFNGEIYEKIGMKFIRQTPPQMIWSKENKKITSNLLRARGYDQLFETSYGKGTSNELLMIENGWLPIYDCGQRVYEFR